METLAVYDINNYLKYHEDVIEVAGKEMEFYPYVGYGDENAPFVIYYLYHGIPSVEAYWNRHDNVRYCIYDVDIHRGLLIAEAFIDLLAKGDYISSPEGKEGTDVRLLSTYFVGSTVSEPSEKEGYYQVDLDFRIYYVKK
jgi:hypothetical protein